MRPAARSVQRVQLRACRGRRCAPWGRDRRDPSGPNRCSPPTHARQARSARWRGRRPVLCDWTRPPPAALRHLVGLPIRRGTPRHGAGSSCGRGHANAQRLPPPHLPTCRNGSHCRHSACRALPRDRAAGCAGCDRAGDRPPCRCGPACGRTRRRAADWRPRGGDAPRPRIYRTHDIADKHHRLGAAAWRRCGSWQSLQVTPAANILLCLNEP